MVGVPLGNTLFSRQTPSAGLYSLVPAIRGVGELFLGQEIFDLAIVGHEFEFGPAIVNTLAFGPPKFRIVFRQCVLSGIELADDPISRRRGADPDDSKELDHLHLAGRGGAGRRSGSTYKPNQVMR
jgi:hypothetical protein